MMPIIYLLFLTHKYSWGNLPVAFTLDIMYVLCMFGYVYICNSYIHTFMYVYVCKYVYIYPCTHAHLCVYTKMCTRASVCLVIPACPLNTPHVQHFAHSCCTRGTERGGGNTPDGRGVVGGCAPYKYLTISLCSLVL